MIGDARRADPARRFPFCAVIDQPDAQLALLLAAVDPAIGGVLLRGDKGSARSTLARGLAGLLPGAARFVDVALGVTEDRVLGSLEAASGLGEHETRFRAGLVAAAHGGVLHLSAVNLLPEHLVEALLDVATSGVNRVERSGIWHEHPAGFVLVASMDPDAGELRPHLLDRFGLAVDVVTPADPAVRAEVVRRRLTHDSGGRVDGQEGDIVLRARLAAALPADLPTSVVDFGCHLAAGLGAEGLRGDLVLCRAAAAFAGWEGRSITTESDVERVAPLALGHRRRRRPFHAPALAPGELERALEAARHAFVPVGNGAGGASGEEAAEATAGDDDRWAPDAAASVTPDTPGAVAPDEGAGDEPAPDEGAGDEPAPDHGVGHAPDAAEADADADAVEATEADADAAHAAHAVDAATPEATGPADAPSPIAAAPDATAPGDVASPIAAAVGDEHLAAAVSGGQATTAADDAMAKPPPPSESTGEPAAQGS